MDFVMTLVLTSLSFAGGVCITVLHYQFKKGRDEDRKRSEGVRKTAEEVEKLKEDLRRLKRR